MARLDVSIAQAAHTAIDLEHVLTTTIQVAESLWHGHGMVTNTVSLLILINAHAQTTRWTTTTTQSAWCR